VNSTGTVTAEAVQPLAAETLEDYRTATLTSFRLEAQGGSAADYRLWALDAQGVAAIYPYTKSGETNANNIYVEATTEDSTDGHGTPSVGIMDDLEEVINFNPDTTLELNERGRRPLNVINYILPVTPIPVDIEITGSSFTVAQQALITTALTNAIALVRPFVLDADVLEDRNDSLDTNKINGIIYSQVPGAVYGAVVLTVGGVEVLSYNFTDGNIPYVDTVTFS
jgi:hypothetical protein